MEDNVWIDSDDAPESQGEYSIYLETLADQMRADLDEIERIVLRIEDRLAQPPSEPPEPEPAPAHALLHQLLLLQLHPI